MGSKKHGWFSPMLYLAWLFATIAALSVTVFRTLRGLVDSSAWPRAKGSWGLNDVETRPLHADPKHRVPLLFVYSKADPITDWRYVRDTVARMKQAGCDNVESVCFKDTPHVGHFVKRHAEYSRMLTNFLSDENLHPVKDTDDWSELDKKLLAKVRKRRRSMSKDDLNSLLVSDPDDDDNDDDQ
eukprot:TRINITY_DN67030_c13_g1_i1.p2 TRINITY_DN67030_c13_g1~~TRINITY_DN67030_c13_g1_i1.p2  ORF type:complete len:184 (+),score=94.20 TRINITY_DN67030_c13_g1_i1:207-758(+)